ncbi:MAG: hypothetical protein AAF791_09425 [Bacteroidota bacterium]
MRRALLLLVPLMALGGGAWAVYAFGPEAMGGPRRVDLGEAPFARLDTVSLARRVVTASVTGRVLAEPTEREVLVSDGVGTFVVRLGADHGVRTGTTVLAVGRVRQPRRGPRRLDAVAWSEVIAAPIPLQAGIDAVRLAPDSTALRALREADPR